MVKCSDGERPEKKVVAVVESTTLLNTPKVTEFIFNNRYKIKD